MRDSPSEIVNTAAEAVSNINTVRLPAEPAEGAVVATTVRTECEVTNFGLGIVGVVYAYEGCSLKKRWVIHHLRNINQFSSFVLFCKILSI